MPRSKDGRATRVPENRQGAATTGALQKAPKEAGVVRWVVGPLVLVVLAAILMSVHRWNAVSVDAVLASLWVPEVVECLARCAALGPKAQAHVARLSRVGDDEGKKSPWLLPLEVCRHKEHPCDLRSQAFCAGLQCSVNASGSLRRWVPVDTAIKPPMPREDVRQRAEDGVRKHLRCAEKCASQARLTVLVGAEWKDSVERAVSLLEECGLVHLVGTVWPDGSFERWRDAVALLKAAPLAKQAELSKKVRAQRTEMFLPMDASLPNPLAEGMVPAVLTKYVGGAVSLDYVSVLDAKAGVADTQLLHYDVPFFPRTSLSAHTALEEITEAMGPTIFCPCTHSVTGWDRNPPAEFEEAVRLASALRSAIRSTGSAAERRCLGAVYLPKSLPAGTVTLYDGALLHAGLANVASRDRLVFNVNYAAPPGYEVVRNYTRGDPLQVNRETERWRARCNKEDKAV